MSSLSTMCIICGKPKRSNRESVPLSFWSLYLFMLKFLVLFGLSPTGKPMPVLSLPIGKGV